MLSRILVEGCVFLLRDYVRGMRFPHTSGLSQKGILKAHVPRLYIHSDSIYNNLTDTNKIQVEKHEESGRIWLSPFRIGIELRSICASRSKWNPWPNHFK